MRAGCGQKESIVLSGLREGVLTAMQGHRQALGAGRLWMTSAGTVGARLCFVGSETQAGRAERRRIAQPGSLNRLWAVGLVSRCQMPGPEMIQGRRNTESVIRKATGPVDSGVVLLYMRYVLRNPFCLQELASFWRVRLSPASSFLKHPKVQKCFF